MSITEPSDAVNTGVAKQTEGRRLALSRKIPSSVTSVVGWLFGWLDSNILASSIFEASIKVGGGHVGYPRTSTGNNDVSTPRCSCELR
jgi:hypothetical protein